MNNIIKLSTINLLLISVFSLYGNVQEIHSSEEFNNIIKSHNTVVVKFYNSGCKFCHDEQAQSLVRGIVNSFPGVPIIGINTDEDEVDNRLIKQHYKINQYPTYLVIKNEREISRILGNNYYGIDGALRSQ